MTQQGSKRIYQLTPTTKICSGKVEIPNTMLAYWAGEFGNFGKTWVNWQREIDTLNARGFNVNEASGWTANTFESYIANNTSSKNLHGIFFWGHGYPTKWNDPYCFLDPFCIFRDGDWGGLVMDAQGSGSSNRSEYSKWNPHYLMGLGIIFACGSNAASTHFSDNGIFKGSEDVLVPIGTPSVSSIILPGVQGTKRK